MDEVTVTTTVGVFIGSEEPGARLIISAVPLFRDKEIIFELKHVIGVLKTPGEKRDFWEWLPHRLTFEVDAWIKDVILNDLNRKGDIHDALIEKL